MIIQSFFSSFATLIISNFRLYIVGFYAVDNKVFCTYLVSSLGQGRVSTKFEVKFDVEAEVEAEVEV